MTGSRLPSQEFKPGELVEVSGIYRVVHDNNHAQPHEVTSVKGEPFPPCHRCSHGVRFILARQTIHVKEHELFADPPPLTSPEIPRNRGGRK